DQDNKLNLAELSKMNSDIIAQIKEAPLSKATKEGEVAEMLTNYFSNSISKSTSSTLDLDQFVALVTGHKTVFHLTGLLFRSPFNIHLVIATKGDYGSANFANKSVQALIVQQSKYHKACQVC